MMKLETLAWRRRAANLSDGSSSFFKERRMVDIHVSDVSKVLTFVGESFQIAGNWRMANGMV